MDDKTMTNEENYRFDVAGYMIVPSVLTAAELNACNQALDQLAFDNGPLRWTSPACNPLRALREHPVLMQYLEQICGEGFRLDESPRARRVMYRGDGPVGGRRVGGLVAGVSAVQWESLLPRSAGLLGAGGRGCGGWRFGRSTGQPQQHGPGPARPSGRNRSYGTRRAAGLAGGRSPALHRVADAGLAALAGRGAATPARMRVHQHWRTARGSVRNPRRRQRAARVGRRSDRYPARRLAQSQSPVPAASGAFGRRKGLAGGGARDFPSLDLHPRPRFRD